MGIAAVTLFVTGGVALGVVAGVTALRKGESPRTVALFSAAGIAIASYMIVQWVFWSSLEVQDMRQALMPDFFSPGRKEKILNWYGLWSASLAGLVVAACGRFNKRGQQA